MGDFHRIRPFKILAVVMVTIAVVLTVVSLAGPEWVKVSFFQGDPKSWALWNDCFTIKQGFEMCVSDDWLKACAALVFLGLFADLLAVGLGVWGLCAKRRTPYIIAGVVCIVSIVLQIICLIIYPVKFIDEVTSNSDYKAETVEIAFDWTYGISWGAVAFLIGASVFFLIKSEDEDNAQPMKSAEVSSPAYYSA